MKKKAVSYAIKGIGIHRLSKEVSRQSKQAINVVSEKWFFFQWSMIKGLVKRLIKCSLKALKDSIKVRGKMWNKIAMEVSQIN